MTEQQLVNEGWKIEQHFHQDECVYYYSATKGRNILTSDDGLTFHGLLNGVWL